MLPADVLADLNATPIQSGSITAGMLSPDLLADLNASGVATISPGSITAGMLTPGLLADLNASTPASDGNGSATIPAGSLIAVQADQPAPAGYSLYQAGEPKILVWEEKAPVSVARFADDGVEVLDGKIYFVVGSGPSAVAERYDPATNQWETLNPMSVARPGVAAAVLNGKIYAIGGEGLSSVEIYDPQTGQWSAGPVLPSEVKHGAAITVGGKILLAGGKNSANQDLDQVLELDPATNQWSQKPPMPTARYGLKLVLVEGKIWAIGGYGGAYLVTIEIYNPEGDSWTAGPSLNTPRYSPSVWVANGRIYVGGGRKGPTSQSTSYLDSLEVYDPTTSQWTAAGFFPENKSRATAAVLGSKVFVVAGATGSGNYSNKVYAANISPPLDLYFRDGNASAGGGTTVVADSGPVTTEKLSDGAVTTAKLAPSSVTTAQLNESILKYLRPEITTSPQAPGLVFGGQSVTLASQAEGKYLTYQWNRNGQPIAGATGATLVISDVNGTLHDGNYTLVVSNDFGSVTSSPTGLQVDATPTNHTVASIGMQMIFCPAGTFTMGSPSSETGRQSDETQHSVTLTNGFYLGKYELTQAQYETVMNGNSEGLNAKPSQWPNNDDRPVEKVSWNDAQVFLSRLNSIEQTAGRLPNGWKYVLPTEAEWEYACRAGTSTIFSWGNSASSTQANFKGTDPYGGGATGPNLQQTTDVGQYAANPWGFFDMHGNVWEWTFDWKANYPGGAQTDPEGSASGSYRVFRGGSWSYAGTYLRAAERSTNSPGTRYHSLGFRVGFKAISADEANPELELFGGAGITREPGQPWAEPGVAAHDARDGNLTAAVTITGTVDVNSTGTYVLTYTVSDAAGNEVNATRTVTVSDTTDPVVTLLGDANVTHAINTAWVDSGATASDTLDGNLTNQVTITGAVDVNSTGAYVLTYSVSDAAGNESNVTRTVNVGMATTHTVQGASHLQMLWVQPGTFTMGSPTTETGRNADREDEHNVTLTKGFYLGKYEVTQAQYEAVMTGNSNSLSATPSEWPNNPNRPVEKVSWDDVQIFLTRLNAAEQAAGRLPSGWSYVLPTEAEWEYACRAGTTTAYSWGDDINSSVANYNQNIGQTRDIGQYAANPWGFFDMHGNVWEWTADWYQAAYSSGAVTDPTGPASGSYRVERGGSWNLTGTSLRSAKRSNDAPGNRLYYLGFRVGFKASQ
jgi:sulfatase modifying factor 1